MTRTDIRIQSFISSIQSYLSQIEDEHLSRFLQLWPIANKPTRVISPCSLPVLSWMDQAIMSGGLDTTALIKLLQKTTAHLAWGQTYTEEDMSHAFLERYGWTELIGLRGPIHSDQMACGFLMLGAETEYPHHRHEAEEIYIPLTANTLWQRGGEGWQKRAVGEPIYHTSWMFHAMRTGESPLLALYLWQGRKLAEKSRFD